MSRSYCDEEAQLFVQELLEEITTLLDGAFPASSKNLVQK